MNKLLDITHLTAIGKRLGCVFLLHIAPLAAAQATPEIDGLLEKWKGVRNQTIRFNVECNYTHVPDLLEKREVTVFTHGDKYALRGNIDNLKKSNGARFYDGDIIPANKIQYIWNHEFCGEQFIEDESDGTRYHAVRLWVAGAERRDTLFSAPENAGPLFGSFWPFSYSSIPQLLEKHASQLKFTDKPESKERVVEVETPEGLISITFQGTPPSVSNSIQLRKVVEKHLDIEGKPYFQIDKFTGESSVVNEMVFDIKFPSGWNGVVPPVLDCSITRNYTNGKSVAFIYSITGIEAMPIEQALNEDAFKLAAKPNTKIDLILPSRNVVNNLIWSGSEFVTVKDKRAINDIDQAVKEIMASHSDVAAGEDALAP